MGIAEIFAFFKALPEMVRVLGQINESLIQLKRDSINKELESIKTEFNKKIHLLIIAKDDNERRKAILDLAIAIDK